MTMMEEEFLQKLREAFAIEAEEHYRTISKSLADLEQGIGDPQPVLELVFREAHSLKGAARAVNRGDIEGLCQALEGLFAIWKKDTGTVGKEQFILLEQATSLLEELLETEDERSLSSEPLASLIDEIKQHCSVLSGSRKASMLQAAPISLPEEFVDLPLNMNAVDEESEASHDDANFSDTSENIGHDLAGTGQEREDASKADTPADDVLPQSADSQETQRGSGASGASAPGSQSVRIAKDTVRVSLGELEALYRQTEELSSIKFMIGRSAAEMKLVVGQCRTWLAEYQKHRQQSLEQWDSVKGTVKDAAYYLEQYEKLLHFVKWTARQIEGVESSVSKGIEDSRGTMYIMDSMSESMIDQAKHLLLMPFALLTDTLSPMVRKLARDLDKNVRFTVRGDDIRIDKRILESLKDPLMHLLRNSVDHGIENPGLRKRKGKPEQGSIDLEISIGRDHRIEVCVRDDGAGIDFEQVKRKAVKEGILKPEAAEAMNDTAAANLIFHSGLSTSSIITDISGRGVGLNVVRENILSLGGEISVETGKDTGSAFRMLLPVSLSNARGVLVRSSGRMYIVPLQHVERGFMVHREDYSELDGRTVMDYEGHTVTVQRLESLLQMPASGKREESTQATLVILKFGSDYLGLEVDEILWEQDVVVKPLPAPVSRVRTIAGASLLGTGELVPVLHIQDVFEAAREAAPSRRTDHGEAEDRSLKKLLVVDDSITSRVLLHDILLSSGYHVKTAVDGIDALTCLREEEFHLVVSDVEMPRMNGFELTESIRRDEKLTDLPVVLVTGLESKEDRERGFDVGANAYIIKSSFDQSNLLGVISRLI